MKIHHFVMLVLVAGMITLGTMNYLNKLGESYGTTADLSSMGNTSHHLAVQENISIEMSEDISKLKLEGAADAILVPYRMIQVGWGVAKQIFGTWTTTTAMIEDTARGMDEAGITLPKWVIPSLVALVVITIGAMIVYAWFKWEWRV